MSKDPSLLKTERTKVLGILWRSRRLAQLQGWLFERKKRG